MARNETYPSCKLFQMSGKGVRHQPILQGFGNVCRFPTLGHQTERAVNVLNDYFSVETVDIVQGAPTHYPTRTRVPCGANEVAHNVFVCPKGCLCLMQRIVFGYIVEPLMNMRDVQRMCTT